MPDWISYTELLARGTWVTLQLTVFGSILALVVTFMAGLARVSSMRLVRIASGFYVEFFRGTSALVQMFWLFFALPLIGIRLGPMTVGVMAVGLNIGAMAPRW